MHSRDGFFVLHLDSEAFLTPQANAKGSHVELAVVLSVADTFPLQCISTFFEPIDFAVCSSSTNIIQPFLAWTPVALHGLPEAAGRPQALFPFSLPLF